MLTTKCSQLMKFLQPQLAWNTACLTQQERTKYTACVLLLSRKHGLNVLISRTSSYFPSHTMLPTAMEVAEELI